MAMLFAPVPPEVKITSSGGHPSISATCSRPLLTAWRAATPYWCGLEGLPNNGPRQGCIASTTSGARGVVAL